MKVLVLGGTGFLGSHIVDRLLEGGHRVRVYSRRGERFRSSLPDVDYRQGDFADKAAVAEALSGVECVVHSLSTMVPSTSNLEPVQDIRDNLVCTVQLLQLMVQTGVPRIVYLSSGGTVYGNPEECPVREEAPLFPLCSYGVVKVAVEKYLHMFQKLHGLEPVVLRPSNPYGERQGHLGVQGIISTFFSNFLAGEMSTIWGNGDTVRDYIHVSDLSELVVAAVEKSVSGVYNAGSGLGVSIRELVAFMEDAVGRPLPLQYAPEREFDVKSVFLNINKSRDVFQWTPEVSLADGLASYWEWLQRLRCPSS